MSGETRLVSLSVELPAHVADQVEKLEEESPQAIVSALKEAALRGYIFEVLTRGLDPEENESLDLILQRV